MALVLVEDPPGSGLYTINGVTLVEDPPGSRLYVIPDGISEFEERLWGPTPAFVISLTGSCQDRNFDVANPVTTSSPFDPNCAATPDCVGG